MDRSTPCSKPTRNTVRVRAIRLAEPRGKHTLLVAHGHNQHCEEDHKSDQHADAPVERRPSEPQHQLAGIHRISRIRVRAARHRKAGSRSSIRSGMWRRAATMVQARPAIPPRESGHDGEVGNN